MNEIQQAYELGQSFWLDFIRRDLVENGELAALIEADEVRGITSNPSIFKQAIADSDLYQASMRPMAHAGWSAEKIFETLAIVDIKGATDQFLPLYEGTGGRDGFVSIEVNPEFAANTEQTLDEARRLWETINRPNLMIKIPATPEGIPAVEQSIYEGININVTLIFSLERYADVMEAYIKGLERRAEEGKPLDRSASVASFFVSRVDTAVDARLEALIKQEGASAERAHTLLGKAAIANAKLAYAQFKVIFNDERFERLRELGARVQRPLWASTSTKNPSYPDVLYVDELIGPETVNTLPPQTLDAFRDHGKAEDKLEAGLSDARAQLEAIEALNIALDEVTLELEQAGVRAFADAYAALIDTVEQRAAKMRAELGTAAASVASHLEKLDDERVAPRFWRTDADLWPETKGGSVIKMRLEWLHADLSSRAEEAHRMVEQVRPLALSNFGWINGGSAREAIMEAIGEDGRIEWLDTLDPADMRRFSRKTPVDSSLFVVESRSHRAPGLMATLAAVWQRARNRAGDEVRNHFVVLAPGGSELDDWSEGQSVANLAEWNFSSGGAVSAAGMWLAALLGANPETMADGAEQMRSACAPGTSAALNPGLYLGAYLAALGPVHIVGDPPLSGRAEWLAAYLRARLSFRVWPGMPEEEAVSIVYLRSNGELENAVLEMNARGASVATLQSDPNLFGIGAEAVRWEVGAAVAAHLLQDSTYAEAPMMPANERLAKMVDRLEKKGSISTPKPNWESEDVSIWWGSGGSRTSDPSGLEPTADLIVDAIGADRPLFIGLYQVPSRSLEAALVAVMQVAKVAVAYGKLPEAKVANGLALLITSAPKKDLELARSQASLGELQLASMLADFEQLREGGSNCCGMHFSKEEAAGIFLKAIARNVGGGDRTNGSSQTLHAESKH